MAHRVKSPEELLLLAQEHGWQVNEYLPDRYDACASTTVSGYEVIVTRCSKTGRWGWTTDPGRDWGRGHRRGNAPTLTAAVHAALHAVSNAKSVLFETPDHA